MTPSLDLSVSGRRMGFEVNYRRTLGHLYRYLGYISVNYYAGKNDATVTVTTRIFLR